MKLKYMLYMNNNVKPSEYNNCQARDISSVEFVFIVLYLGK